MEMSLNEVDITDVSDGWGLHQKSVTTRYNE